MDEATWPAVTCAVEGVTDQVVLERILRHVGLAVGPVHGLNGKQKLRGDIGNYNRAARQSPWVVLVNLDREECAPSLRSAWLPTQAPLTHLRVVVHAVEAWLLADHERMAAFLGVAEARLPANPESLDSPKTALVDLARKSRIRAVREAIVPKSGSTGTVGTLYAASLIEFVTSEGAGWRPEVAATRADSLRRCLASLRQLRDAAAAGA